MKQALLESDCDLLMQGIHASFSTIHQNWRQIIHRAQRCGEVWTFVWSGGVKISHAEQTAQGAATGRCKIFLWMRAKCRRSNGQISLANTELC